MNRGACAPLPRQAESGEGCAGALWPLAGTGGIYGSRTQAPTELVIGRDDIRPESFDVVMIVGHPSDQGALLLQCLLLVRRQIASISTELSKELDRYVAGPTFVSRRTCC